MIVISVTPCPSTTCTMFSMSTLCYNSNLIIDALAPVIKSLTTSFSLTQCRQFLGKKSMYAFMKLNRMGHEPFNLVPIGSPVLLIRTQALSSNFTTLPSGLCSFFFVRTTTACLISPRRTLLAADVDTLPLPGPDSGPKLRCFWTTTIMRSPGICQFYVLRQAHGVAIPIFACLFIRRTLTHSTTAAPELSMQLSIVYGKI